MSNKNITQYINSPIFYMGNKIKLINKGLIDLFPQNIATFYDLFGGSSVVSLNTKADRYIVNDFDTNVYNFYKMFNNNNADKIIQQIVDNITKFDLPRYSVKQNTEYGEIVKQNYLKLRDYANTTKDIIDLYTCLFYAFSQQMRFNKRGLFNMPRGNGGFTEQNEQYIRNMCNFIKNNKVLFYNKNYNTININKIAKDSFVYLDPPYLNSTATYNENGGWNMKDEETLFKFCENLNQKGINFGLSNIFKNKNIVNTHLIDWCKNNNWNVFYFDKFKYYACGKGASDTTEVYISNYCNKGEQDE